MGAPEIIVAARYGPVAETIGDNSVNVCASMDILVRGWVDNSHDDSVNVA